MNIDLLLVTIFFLAGFFVRPLLKTEKEPEEPKTPRVVVFSENGLLGVIIAETSRGLRIKAPTGWVWSRKESKDKHEKFFYWKDLDVEEPMRTYVKMKLEEEKALEEL